MFRWFRASVIWGIAPPIALVAVVWLALEYFVPSLPARMTIGAGGKGTSFEYFAEHYQKRFARAGVNLVVRETAGALENLELLKDPNSGVQIGFVTGGLSNNEDAPNLLSMGLISNVPFWIFYPSSESLTGLSQLRGKRIAVGPVHATPPSGYLAKLTSMQRQPPYCPFRVMPQSRHLWMARQTLRL
jgi:TRAP-type uncharacterized transport system substrate-binding protein